MIPTLIIVLALLTGLGLGFIMGWTVGLGDGMHKVSPARHKA